MVTCPECFCKHDVREIQLERIYIDLGEYFYCKKCDNYFMLNMIDEEYEPEIMKAIKELK